MTACDWNRRSHTALLGQGHIRSLSLPPAANEIGMTAVIEKTKAASWGGFSFVG